MRIGNKLLKFFKDMKESKKSSTSPWTEGKYEFYKIGGFLYFYKAICYNGKYYTNNWQDVVSLDIGEVLIKVGELKGYEAMDDIEFFVTQRGMIVYIQKCEHIDAYSNFDVLDKIG